MKRSVVLAGAAVLLTAGCTQAEVVHTGSASATSRAATSRPHRAKTTQRPSSPPQPTAKPVTRDGTCPYLPTQFVMDTVGQHITTTTVTTTVPASCAFYRPDNALAAKVDGIQATSTGAAAAKVASVTGSGANPVSGVGDGGAVAITGTGAVLAVSQGTTVLVVTINQQSSLEATEIAKQALARL
jgi:hypothetical protein